MIPLKAEPSAIATRMKVGIEAETWVLSDSGTFAMIRLLTKLQDIPKPVPIITESMPIAQSGPNRHHKYQSDGGDTDQQSTTPDQELSLIHI